MVVQLAIKVRRLVRTVFTLKIGLYVTSREERVCANGFLACTQPYTFLSLIYAQILARIWGQSTPDLYHVPRLHLMTSALLHIREYNLCSCFYILLLCSCVYSRMIALGTPCDCLLHCAAPSAQHPVSTGWMVDALRLPRVPIYHAPPLEISIKRSFRKTRTRMSTVDGDDRVRDTRTKPVTKSFSNMTSDSLCILDRA